MNRNEILNEVLKANSNNISLELATGTGKTKMCLEYINTKIGKKAKILVVEPRLVLIDNFKKEIEKWNYKFKEVEFTTYNSLEKHINKKFDIIVYDEAHHFTERCADIVKGNIRPKYVITLSATLKDKVKISFENCYGRFFTYKYNLQNAINSNILVEPTIYIVPLKLGNIVDQLFPFQINKNTKVRYEVFNSSQAFSLKSTKANIFIKCSAYGYYNQLKKQFDWAKRHDKMFMLKRIGLEMLNYCSQVKSEFIINLLKILDNKRTLTFCHSIEQTELFGNDINSKNKKSKENLDNFNNGVINHISGVDMLNEGININNCNIGIFCKINRSQIMQIQKLGRILRSDDPKIIIPYFVDTREELVVQEMIETNKFNKIIKLSSYEEIKNAF